MDSISKFAPLSALAGFLGAIIFVSGFFYFLGPEWITILTIQDLFALSWLSAPVLVIAALGGSLIWGINPQKPKFRKLSDVREKIHAHKSIGKFLLNMYLIGIYISPFLIGGLFFYVVPKLSPRWALGALSVVVLSLPVIDRYIDYYVPADSQQKSRRVAIGFIALYGVFFIGVTYGYSRLAPDKLDLIHRKGTSGDLCAAIVFAGERGLIVNTPPKALSLIRWDEVSGFDRSVPCKANQTAKVQANPTRETLSPPTQKPLRPSLTGGAFAP